MTRISTVVIASIALPLTVGCTSTDAPSAKSTLRGPPNTQIIGGGAPGSDRLIDPIDNPGGTSLSLDVHAEQMPLGTVPFDGFSLPLVSPNGRHIATQVGSPPDWPTTLAERDQQPPHDTAIEVYEFDMRQTLGPEGRLPPHLVARLTEPAVLGRAADGEGFLVESPRPNGARWIGKASWNTGEITWLVKDASVNAFAALMPDGRLAWCRRAIDADHFDLVARGVDGVEWSLSGGGGDWLMPVWSSDDDGLFALHRQDGRLRICFGLASGQRTFSSTMRDFLLMRTSDKYAAYQTFASQGATDGSLRSRQPQVFLLHPGLGRMIIWRPMASHDNAAVQLNAASLAAVQQSAESALVCLKDELLLQSLSKGDVKISLSAGTWVPRRTPGWEFSYVGLSPETTRVQVSAMTLRPRQAPVPVTTTP